MRNSRDVMKVVLMLLVFLLLDGPSSVVAAAVPTPVPGGANQVGGVSGTLSQVLFNGTLRLRAMSLRDAVPADNVRPNAAGQRALVFRAIVSNGTKRENHGFFNAALSDADGITIEGRPLDDGWTLAPAAATHLGIAFSVPAGFVPTKLVLIQAAVSRPAAFRIALRPTDLGPAPTPAP
ncbi:MAG TPA: hypothetical protein VHS78_10920 [Candidatus Elarobacter sp.]|jgi:hypothetical protein|nr:hypothetical protein [Candidatus Elarobacter sp.]